MKNRLEVEATLIRMDVKSEGKTLIPPKVDSKGRPIPWTEDETKKIYRQDGVYVTIETRFYLPNKTLPLLVPGWERDVIVSFPIKKGAT